jgi:poly-gamma-glutamate capsule biosynthesis protein CapA/YwtB (metallophosphatase superfamily)
LAYDILMFKLRAVALLVSLILLASCLPSRKTVTLALLGDLMVGRKVNAKPASLSFLASELKTADLSLANLESPLTPGAATTASDGYNLCASSEFAGLFRVWGLDLLSLANNHRFDCGPAGDIDTLQALTAAGETPVGPGPEPVYRQVNGLKLGFFSFDDILSPIDVGAAIHSIQSARFTGAVVVVSVHWGAEYQQGLTARQKALARQFAEAGALLIVGTHPHVLQPVEWIQTSRGRTLVLYSLGNALFDQVGLPDTRQSALLLATLNAQGVQSIRAKPFEIDVIHSILTQPDPATATEILARLNLP